MAEVDEAAKQIAAQVDPDANIIFGATIDESMVDQVKITIIATGFDETKRKLREMTASRGQTQTTFAQPFIRQPVQSQTNGEKPILPQAEDVPPEEDEFDIPAFLRQRN